MVVVVAIVGLLILMPLSRVLAKRAQAPDETPAGAHESDGEQTEGGFRVCASFVYWS